MSDEEALFEWDVPVRKGSREYLIAIAGVYGGLSFWSLAPIDRAVRENHGRTDADTDFVWLADGAKLHWALVDIEGQEILALDPDPIDKTVRDALAAANT